MKKKKVLEGQVLGILGCVLFGIGIFPLLIKVMNFLILFLFCLIFPEQGELLLREMMMK